MSSPKNILILGIVLSLVWGLIVWKDPIWLKNLDNIFFDTLVRFRSNDPPSDQTVLVDVDDESLIAVGQWPWLRYRLAAMVNNLTVASPAALGLGILFSEPDRTSWSTLQDTFKREFDLEITISGLPRGMEDNDAYFGHTLARTRTAGAVFFSHQFENLDHVCNMRPLDIKGDLSGLQMPEASGILCNVPAIQAGLEISGFINTESDQDGILRRMPLLAKYAGRFYPSLSLAVLILATGESTLHIDNDIFGPRLRLGNRSIPIDRQGRALLRFHGTNNNFHHLSALDVLTENFDPALLRNRIVLMGSSAAGLMDLHQTATAKAMPGFEINAVFIHNTLSASHYREPIWISVYTTASTILAGIIVSLLLCLSTSVLISTGAVLVVLLFPLASMILFWGCDVLLTTAGPILAGGSLLVLLSTIMGITIRIKAHTEKEKLKMQLINAQKLESVGRLAGGVAHDFNNLLQVIGGNIQLLLQGRLANHPEAARLKTISASIDRASQLVRQLLLFSRKAEAQLQQVDVNHEVKNTVKMLERTIPKMITVELDLAPSIWSIQADPVQVEQVLLNLGGNAVDAMPEGGTLTIATRNIASDENFVLRQMETEPKHYVLMVVSDTGSGMDKETLAHIFEPFFTTKEVGRGTGLGLASVYGIIKKHGAHVLCDSEPGKGTTFMIYWPAIKDLDRDTDQTVSAPAQKPARGNAQTIMVVDDEKDIGELTSEALQDFGYTVLLAASGEEAVALYDQQKASIEMVILDLNMPGMGGHQCLRELLKLNPDVRVLISSGYSAADQLKETMQTGAAGFIGKPYQLTELLDKVREILSGQNKNARQ